jgi:choline-glycine betaine transporter
MGRRVCTAVTAFLLFPLFALNASADVIFAPHHDILYAMRENIIIIAAIKIAAVIIATIALIKLAKKKKYKDNIERIEREHKAEREQSESEN